MKPAPDQSMRLTPGSDAMQGTSESVADRQTGAATRDELEQWRVTTETLCEMLDASGGTVASRTLCPELEKRGVINAREMQTKLKLFDFDDPDPHLPRPTFRYYHRGRSFYSEEAFRAAETETEAAAKAAERDVQFGEASEDEEEEIPAVKKKSRQEEARMGKYLEEALESLYASQFGPDARIGFDIHNERPGTEFENVDAIAVHWRTDEVVELVAVESKLQFSPRLVLQAANYKRFADRVWVAVPVSSDEPAVELRENDSLLFEYVVELGIGMLACRKRQGGAYEVSPIHWPSLNKPDSLAREAFIERYRHVFEEACVVEPKQRTRPPRLR